jgi:RecG-like helicase
MRAPKVRRREMRDQHAQACAPQTLTYAQIIVGTHALLYESVSFSNLGLAVIDEQHKFGVAQRARLTAREPAPDVLVMTATPSRAR